MKIALLYGGMGSEHDISIMSAKNIFDNLNKQKYLICPVYISKNGEYFQTNMVENNGNKIDNIINYLKSMDIIFPVLHGKYGEDGTIQGLCELIGKPYVGCKVLSSSLCMDKISTKRILEANNIKSANYISVKKINNNYIYINKSVELINYKELLKLINGKFNYPLYVKPSNSGSSIGISRVTTFNDLNKALKEALKYDNKVLIEEEIKGREFECAVLFNKSKYICNIGEVKRDNFYSYDLKYLNNTITEIPAKINKELERRIIEIAKKVFVLCDCDTLARIDIFVEDNTNNIYINEVNTMPGFTNISMYPKLINSLNISYSKLLDIIISNAK